MTTRRTWLDALRGIAVLSVIACHALPLLAPAAALRVGSRFDFGSFGVLLFFLVSGTLIPESLRHGSIVHFWIKRVCRLYPLYWCSVAAAAVLASIAPAAVAGTPEALVYLTEHLGTAALANASMLQELVAVPHLLPVYWTLTFELIFYALMSALVATRVDRHVDLLTVALALLAVILPLTPVCGLGSACSGLPLRNVSYLALLLVPVALRTATSAGRHRVRWFLEGLILLLFLGTLLRSFAAGAAWITAYTLFRLAQHNAPSNVPALAVSIGTVSYALYLGHPLVLAALPSSSSPLVTLLVWSAVLIPAAIAAERFIERPGIRLGRVLVGRLQARGAPVAVFPLPVDTTP